MDGREKERNLLSGMYLKKKIGVDKIPYHTGLDRVFFLLGSHLFLFSIWFGLIML